MSITSCAWHAWPARSGSRRGAKRTDNELAAAAHRSRASVQPIYTAAPGPCRSSAMARQVFSLLPAHHPSVGAHRRPERVGSAFSPHPRGPRRPPMPRSPAASPRSTSWSRSPPLRFASFSVLMWSRATQARASVSTKNIVTPGLPCPHSRDGTTLS